MDMVFKKEFIDLWQKFFPAAEPPIACFFTDERPEESFSPAPSSRHRCVMADLNRARKGEVVCLDADTIGCSGGRRYFGFNPGEIREDFEHFLSCGLEGRVEGERYKKTPELVKQIMARTQPITAPAAYIVFKPWDALQPDDRPELVSFYAGPDVLSGLFTLAGFDRADLQPVIAPFGAGCATIVQYPYLEMDSDLPR